MLPVRIGLGEPGEIGQGGHPVVLCQLAAGEAVERPLPELVFLLERQQFFEDPLLGSAALEAPERLAPVVEGRRPQVFALDPGEGAERSAQAAAVVLLDSDAEVYEFRIACFGETAGDLPVVLVGLPVVPGLGEAFGAPHRPRILLGGGRRLDVRTLVELRQLPARGQRLLVGRHVVVERFEFPGGFFASSESLERSGGGGQRFAAEREATLGGSRFQVGQGFFARSGPGEAASEIEAEAVPVPVVGEFVENPAEERDPVLAAHPGKAPAEEMEGVRGQFAVCEFGRGEPFFGFGPAAAPEGVGPQPVGGRGPAACREGGIVGDRAERLLPVRPGFDGRGAADGGESFGQFFEGMPGDPGNRLGFRPLRRGGSGLADGYRQEDQKRSGRDRGTSSPRARAGGTHAHHRLKC